MHNRIPYLSRLAILFLTFSLLLSGCQKKRQDVSSVAGINPYVFAYTSGMISRVDPIRIELNQTMIEAEDIGTELSGTVLQFSPKIKGTLSWEDRRTLRFTPDEPLASATTFTGTLDVRHFFAEAPSEHRQFAFEFRTRDQHLQVDVEGLRSVQLNDLTRMALTGTIYTADKAADTDLEVCLTAKQNGDDLPITWTHSSDGRAHEFQVDNIVRTEAPGTVSLAWNARPIDARQSGEQTVRVPALGTFELLEAKVVARTNQFISLQFSDPVDAQQDLNGLIQLAGYDGTLSFLVDNNFVRVYPRNAVSGVYSVQVASSIRNVNDNRLERDATREVEFAEIRPQVRLVGSGVIMPDTDGLLFPFEAIGLNKVEVEIFKVFHTNMLQFLQTNALSQNYSLQQVGRIIRTEEVDLRQLNPDASTTRWTRFALDLRQLLREDPEAMYSIRIGFRPQHATLACAALEAERHAYRDRYSTRYTDPNQQKSIMDSWSGILGYYDDYSYARREDPCYPEYYNSNRFVMRNVLSSNLGIMAKQGKTQATTVVVTDLRTAEPVSGAEVITYDYQQQELARTRTNGNGIAELTSGRKPFMLIARSGQQTGYLRLTDNEALSISRFDVTGAETQEGLKGFLYGERGVWRPGDSVYLNFILEDKANPLPDNYPLTFQVFNARGQLFLERTVLENKQKLYPLHFATPAEAPTGSWRAVVQAGGATFEKILPIETVRPNRIDIDIDAGIERITGTQPVPLALEAKWLHGAPAGGLKARMEASLRPVPTTFNDYPGYVFDDPARAGADLASQVIFDGTLDAQGRANVNWELPDNLDVPGMMRVGLRTRVFEQGGTFSTDNMTIPLAPYATYAGIDIPKNKYGNPRIEIGESARIGLVNVNMDGRPVAGRTLAANMYRVDWRWWWDDGYDNMSRFNTRSNYTPVARRLLVTNNQGEAEWNLTVDEWGRYFIRVCDEVSGHCTGSFLYAGYPWYGDDNYQQRQQAAILNFSSDQDKYAVGETVTLTIPSGIQGRALISIENGSEVVTSFWEPTTEGENQFSFEVTEAMSPNVYAHISMIQPHQQTENDLPIRMYGVIPIRVEDPETVLEPTITMPDELKPESTFTVEVGEANRQDMTYTLAVVDEGLLGLTRYQTPDPHGTFYAREALGVRTWDLYDNVLGASGGDLSNVLSIGGDAALSAVSVDPVANRFEPVVRFLGPFELRRGRPNKHSITLPNYVGAVRTMVVARSGSAYGKAEKRTTVQNPIMLLASLPRMLAPGETLRLPVNVFVNQDNISEVSLRVQESSGLVRFPTGQSTQVRVDGQGSQMAYFDVTVGDRPGVARFVVSASAQGEEAKQEIEIAIRNPNPYQTVVYKGSIEGGNSWEQAFAALGMAGTQKAWLEVSSIPPMNLERHIRSLLRYPYGCIEQTISSAFPQLYAGQLMELSGEQQQGIPQRVNATIQRLSTFQLPGGGFAYWPGTSDVSPWGSSYAGHFMLEAKEKGYRIPPALLNDWITFQQKQARNWSLSTPGDRNFANRQQQLEQAYRLYTLALAGKADLAAMNRLREMDQLLYPIARWQLAGAYARSGKMGVARELIQNVSSDMPQYRELGTTYGSTLRDQAMVLEVMVLLGQENQAAPLLQEISQAMSGSDWLSTQEMGYAMLAVSKYLGDQELEDTFRFTWRWNGQAEQDAGTERAVMAIDLSAQLRPSNQITVTNPGNNRLFVQVVTEGKPLPGEETGQTNNLDMQVNFLHLDGSPLDPTQIPQGKDFIAEVRITHPGQFRMAFEELALDQVFPSGWEILNARMSSVGNAIQSNYDYQDVRDDRVSTFFDLNPGNSRTYRVQLNAAYRGRFYLPGTSCTAMYDNSISAYAPGQWIEVQPPSTL